MDLELEAASSRHFKRAPQPLHLARTFFRTIRSGSIMKPPCDEAVIKFGSATAPCEEAAEPWILAATILGSSMAFVDSTVVNVALPAIQSSLGGTVINMQWVVEAYALLLSALILTGGVLGDVFGRKPFGRMSSGLLLSVFPEV